ncbi:hypothetical protein DFJ73DRAFT_823156 [Zopfochytrium polystomum]|nr:hypothetical protein DFJ73DRAFT_823156 [Zopfochytrium polystomum]
MEDEVCRVCRSTENTPAHPLFHPCKCSGSMKFVHQDCLEEWLSHSRKRHCEICNYQFAFTPIYAEQAPESISIGFFLSSVLRRANTLIRFYVRVLFSLCVWLLWVPYVTVWVWRIWFNPMLLLPSGTTTVFQNSTAGFSNLFQRWVNATDPAESSLLDNADDGWLTETYWKGAFESFVSDVFEGQIITSVAIIVGLALTCFKDYVVLNTPVDANGQPVNPPVGDVVDNNVEPQVEDDLPAVDGFDEMMDVDGWETESDADVELPYTGPTNVRPLDLVDFGPRPTSNNLYPSEGSLNRRDQDGSRSNSYSELWPSDNVNASASASSSRDKGKAPMQQDDEHTAGPSNSGEARPSTESPHTDFDHVEGNPRFANFAGEPSFSNFGSPSGFASQLRGDGAPSEFQARPIPVPEPSRPENFMPPLPPRVQARRPIPPVPRRPPRPVAPVREVPAREAPPVPFNVNVQLEVGPDGVAAEVQAQGDVNAFLELVGIQGPIDGLLHNAALAVLVIVVVIGAGVWAPYITGRFIMWLFSDVYLPAFDAVMSQGTALLQRFTDPILDPIVDGLMVIARELGLIVSNVANATDLASVETAIASGVAYSLATNLSIVASANVSDVLSNDTSPFANSTLPSANETVVANEASIPESESKLEKKYFGIPEKIFFIVIGYLTHSFILYNHARRTGRLQHPYAQTVRRIIIQWMGYVVVACKFSFFITIELGMFPTFCGILIDLCTLPVFGGSATLANRIAFYEIFPWTSWFLHWLTGTSFMFQFALYIATVRKIVRPGVIWFVRDPDDPDFHPMQDIIEKPMLLQLRKLAFGALMYAVLIIGNVGGVVLAVRLVEIAFGASTGPGKFWPIKWEFTEPLSEFPVDLLIFHFVLPWAIGWTRPRMLFKQLLAAMFRFSARRLRLTHFLFGRREADEESEEEDDPITYATFQAAQAAAADAAIHGTEADENVNARRAGREARYMRVPNHDHIEVIPRQRVLLPMRRGEPVIGRAHENEDDVRTNWTRVYVPDRFRLRVAILVVFQWLAVVGMFTLLTVVPLFIGRALFLKFYSFVRSDDPLSDYIPKIRNISYSRGPSTRMMEQSLLSNSSSGNRTAMAATSQVTWLGFSLHKDLQTRPDLPVHDLFSYAIGFITLVAIASAGIKIQRAAHWLRRVRMEARRSLFPGQRVLRPSEVAPHEPMGDVEPPAPPAPEVAPALRGIFQTFAGVIIWLWSASLTAVVMAAKLLFLVFWVGVAIPLCLGLLFHVYVVLPMTAMRDTTRIFFLFQDWAMGALYTKIIYTLVLAGPDNEFRRTLNDARTQLRDSGLRGFRVEPFALKVVFPFMFFAYTLLSASFGPFNTSAILTDLEHYSGTKSTQSFLYRHAVPIAVGLLVSYEVFKLSRRLVRRWMEQVRDEHFLVGRKLHNVTEATQTPANGNGGGDRLPTAFVAEPLIEPDLPEPLGEFVDPVA